MRDFSERELTKLVWRTLCLERTSKNFNLMDGKSKLNESTFPTKYIEIGDIPVLKRAVEAYIFDRKDKFSKEDGDKIERALKLHNISFDELKSYLT